MHGVARARLHTKESQTGLTPCEYKAIQRGVSSLPLFGVPPWCHLSSSYGHQTGLTPCEYGAIQRGVATTAHSEGLDCSCRKGPSMCVDSSWVHAHAFMQSAPHVHAPLAEGFPLSLGTRRDERSRCVPAHTLHGGAQFICKFCRARPLPHCNLPGSQPCCKEQTSSTTGSIPLFGYADPVKVRGDVPRNGGDQLGPGQGNTLALLPRGISGSAYTAM